jgi:hypothetical protein
MPAINDPETLCTLTLLRALSREHLMQSNRHLQCIALLALSSGDE